MKQVTIATPGPMLDTLCPMHLLLDSKGTIIHAGPTVRKVLGERDLIGNSFLDVFEVKRPRLEPGANALQDAAGRRLHCILRGSAQTELKGVAVPLSEEQETSPPGGMIVNLSFGIGVMDAVARYDLTNRDFAVTDLAVEMLYLIEAKSAVLNAWQRLNQRLQGAKAVAERQAYTDTLTGLRNRRALEPAMRRLTERGADFTLMHLDLDFFKSVNDTLGHAAGDNVLRRVARILREETREEDTVIRVGGDEFVLIFADRLCEPDLSEMADRLIRRLEEPMTFNGELAQISGSIGSTCSARYDTPRMAVMMDDADLALYAAKEAGRGRHVAFTGALRKAVESRSDGMMSRA